MEARGNVVVVRTDGATLRTEVIRYSQVRNQVSSDKDFVFDEPTRHIKGTGFTADADFKVVTANRVTGEGGKFTLPNQSWEPCCSSPSSSSLRRPPTPPPPRPARC